MQAAAPLRDRLPRASGGRLANHPGWWERPVQRKGTGPVCAVQWWGGVLCSRFPVPDVLDLWCAATRTRRWVQVQGLPPRACTHILTHSALTGTAGPGVRVRALYLTELVSISIKCGTNLDPLPPTRGLHRCPPVWCTLQSTARPGRLGRREGVKGQTPPAPSPGTCPSTDHTAPLLHSTRVRKQAVRALGSWQQQ